MYVYIAIITVRSMYETVLYYIFSQTLREEHQIPSTSTSGKTSDILI